MSKENKIYKVFQDNPLNIFISSNCEDQKFLKVRKSLKKILKEEIGANVYLYEEDDHGSTMDVESAYLLHLEKSDICIVIIDNKEGVRQGVQKEIDYANKHNIKILYLFSAENSSEATSLEKRLKAECAERYKKVDKLEDIIEESAQSLVNDIYKVFLAYINNKTNITFINNEEVVNNTFKLSNNEQYLTGLSKKVLEKIDKSTGFLHEYLFGPGLKDFFKDENNSSNLDKWCLSFMKTLINHQSIEKTINIDFIDELYLQQGNDLNKVVKLRWKSINEYFKGNVKECITYINEAYEMAKSNNLQIWIINDLLIDLRNLHYLDASLINAVPIKDSAQEELDNNIESLYFPILDRINSDLQEFYTKQLYKEKIKSPNTITIGVNYVDRCKMLATYLITAMYYGSLTHILLFYEKLKDFIFFLNCNYNDWHLRRELYVSTIFTRKKDDIKNLELAFPEVLNLMNSADASYIMKSCQNQPIKYYRRISEYLSFGSVGYYLSDNEFNKHKTIIFSHIYNWIDDKECIINEGKYIFDCLNNIAYRINQNELIDLCCRFIDKKYTRLFDDLFDFMCSFIDLSIVNSEDAIKLLNKIEELLLNDDVKEIIAHNNSFLSKFRKQVPKITNHLDKVISQTLPEYYDGTYKFETTSKKQEVYSEYIEKYIKIMESNNQNQGKNGVYYDYGINYYETIRRIVLDIDYKCRVKIQDKIIECVCETLKNTDENVSVRLSAISLLLTLLLKFNNSYGRNKKLLDDLMNNEDQIKKNDSSDIFANINVRALSIGFLLIKDLIELGDFENFVENMTYVNNEPATILAVQNLFIKYLSSKEGLLLRDNMNSSILQYTLQWLKEDSLIIKRRAVRLLLLLASNPKNVNSVNFEILNLIDNSNGYIKSYILQNIKRIENLPKETINYIYTKCENDQCFMVRKICYRVKNNIPLWN